MVESNWCNGNNLCFVENKNVNKFGNMYGKLRMNKINQNKNKTDVKKINALLWIF